MDELGRGDREMPAGCPHDLAGGGVDGFDEGCGLRVQDEGLEALRKAFLADGLGGADVLRLVDLPPYFWKGAVHALGLDDASVALRDEPEGRWRHALL